MSATRIVYLNGEFLPVTEAHVSVMDRGFLFGDGIYEVVPVYNGNMFRLTQHLQRLQRSLKAIQIDMLIDHTEWQAIFSSLLQRNNQDGSNNHLIYLQITRGSYTNRTHVFPETSKPTLFAQCTPFQPLTIDELSQGAAAITLPDNRWAHCSIKSINLLGNVLLAEQAYQQHVKEAILLRQDKVTEGTITNVFIVKNNTIITPPLTDNILGGITREFVLELAEQHHLPYREESISEQELRTADEIWMSGSSKTVMPITMLDGKVVGNGKAGPIWWEIIKHYHHYKNHLLN